MPIILTSGVSKKLHCNKRVDCLNEYLAAMKLPCLDNVKVEDLLHIIGEFYFSVRKKCTSEDELQDVTNTKLSRSKQNKTKHFTDYFLQTISVKFAKCML